MRLVATSAVLALAVGAAALAQESGPSPASRADLSQRAAELESALRRASGAEARRQLRQRLELVLHQMGPTDAQGRRVHPQAMWHDRALERLEREMKPLATPPADPASADGRTLVRLGRLQVRRMAAACLTLGWRLGDGGPQGLSRRWAVPKYGADAFGGYLVGNLPVLDRLMQRLAPLVAASAGAPQGDAAEAGAGASGRPDGAGAAETSPAARRSGPETPAESSASASAPAPAGSAAPSPAPGAGAAGTTVASRARAGVAKLAEAAEAVEEAARTAGVAPQPPKVAPALSMFQEGLEAIREAVQGAGEAEAPSGRRAPAAPPPPMTAEERARLDAVRAAAGDLEGPPWGEVAERLERFADLIEAGFAIERTRARARDLLLHVDRAATMARELAGAAPLLGEEVLESRVALLRSALRYMAKPARRADGLILLDLLEAREAFRRQVQGSVLPEVGRRALLRLYYRVALPASESEKTSTRQAGADLRQLCRRLGRALAALEPEGPADMVPGLKVCYQRQASLFLKRVTEGAAAAGETPASAAQALAPLEGLAETLDLLVRADAVVRAVRRFGPASASAVAQRITHAAQDLVVHAEEPTRPRARLLAMLRPFEALVAFPTLEPAHRRALTRLLGRGYVAAEARLARETTAGIQAAARGDPLPLQRAVGAKDLFVLARLRAVAETENLAAVPVTELEAFPIPPEVWTAFGEALDGRLRTMFAEYVRGQAAGSWSTMPAYLEPIYGPVVAAQRLAAARRRPGTRPIERLTANLARTAVASPSQDRLDGWIVGHHLVEAATALLAEMTTVADWHLNYVRRHRRFLQAVDPGARSPAPGRGAE